MIKEVTQYIVEKQDECQNYVDLLEFALTYTWLKISNWVVFVKSLSSRLRKFAKEEVCRKCLRARYEGWLQGNSIFQAQHDWFTCQVVESIKASTKDKDTFKSDKVPAPRNRRRQIVITLAVNLFVIYNFEKEKSVISNQVSLIHQTHSRAGLIVRGSQQ